MKKPTTTAEPATELLTIGALAKRVEQCGFDCALGKAVLSEGRVQPVHQRGDAVSVGADELGCKVGVDGQFHAFGRLGAVGQTTDSRALAGAHGSVRASDAHQHQRLAVHYGH